MSDPRRSKYRGRFAPSPTGSLHFGSLIAAVGSYLQARRQQGEWLVRIEDVDTVRCRSEHAGDILRTLEAFGFEWDGDIIYQSHRNDFYESALQTLKQQRLIYACDCSRKQINEATLAGPLGPVYPGTCRARTQPPRHEHAVRLITDSREIIFADALQGRHQQNLARESGDFVVRRRDGLFAYQLAVILDDAEQGITEVVRGADLLDSTPRQIYLQQVLGYSTPDYIHLPLALDRCGAKLSKSQDAPSIDPKTPLPALYQALSFLGQEPPAELLEGGLEEFWRWSVSHWRLDKIPRMKGQILRQ